MKLGLRLLDLLKIGYIFGFLEVSSNNKFFRDYKVKINWLLRISIISFDMVIKEKFFLRDFREDSM